MAKISKHGGSGGPDAGKRQLFVRVKTAKKRTLSSQKWLERQLNDPYVIAAKRDGWRSRAAFKLIELDDKLRFLRPGYRVVDLGAAPGGWAQVAAERVKSLEGRGQVIAIDISEMESIPGVDILHMDFMLETAPAELVRRLR
jgi:23S rRNA (uridine2552-2'-O)-methyltransferase